MTSIALRVVAVALFALLAGGCATPYQDMGFAGGVSADQITSETYRIVSQGNSYTAGTAIQDYVLLKAAETTKQAGGTHFIIISAQDASRVSVEHTSGTAQTNVIGSTAFTTYSPGSSYTSVKPGENAYIRVLKLRPGEPPPSGAFFADEIIQFVGSRVKRAK